MTCNNQVVSLVCNVETHRLINRLCRLVKLHLKAWKEITSNKFILDIVQGYVIEFTSVPIQSSQPKQPKFEKHEEIALNALLEEI